MTTACYLRVGSTDSPWQNNELKNQVKSEIKGGTCQLFSLLPNFLKC